MHVEIVRDNNKTARLVFRYKREGKPAEARICYLLKDLYGYKLLGVHSYHNLVIATVHKCA